MTNALAFNNVSFSVIDKDNHVWLKASEIAKALGYKEENAITKLYNRNAGEFTTKMTQVIEIFDKPNLGITENLTNKVRVFSLRGCHLLAMFARTGVAKDFRKWVLDVLERQGIENKLTLSTARTRKPLSSLVDVWVKQGNLFHTMCWKQVSAHFNLKSITELPTEWLPDAIAFVQSKIDALPKAEQKTLPSNQLSLEECTKDYIIEDNPNDRYYKMMEKLHNDMKLVRTHINFQRSSPRFTNLPKELDALHKNAEDSVNMALHGLSIAQYALHNAIRIRAEFEFVNTNL